MCKMLKLIDYFVLILHVLCYEQQYMLGYKHKMKVNNYSSHNIL